MRILLVDDHPLIHDALGLIISTYADGTQHESVTGFSEACNRLVSPPSIDLLLLDLGLPGFSDVGALIEVRARFPEIPVVVISAREGGDVIHACIEAGAMGYIPKTFKPDKIKAALRVVATGGVFVPEDILVSAGSAGGFDHSGRAPLSDEAVRERLGLTPRQFDVLKLLVRGMTNKRIARHLGLSDNTVKAHVGAVLRSLDAANRTEAVVMASRYGLRALT